MQTKQIGIILLIGLLILGVIGAGIPYTTSQFIWQSTDLNYVKFYAGEYDGNGLIIDGNIFTIFDFNGSSGGGTLIDTNFETAGLTLIGSNTGDQDLSGLVPYSGATSNVDIGVYDISATDGLFSGNVGIGTATPSEKLEVHGNIRVPSTTFAEQYGIIYKGTIPFIHDFSYGLNAGGITPVGRNTFVGVDAGNFTMGSTATTTSQASYNTAMGYLSLYANTTGSYNNAMGYLSLYANTTGSYNNAMGYYSLRYNTTGSYNNAMGVNSLRYNTTGSYNNAIGASSLYNNTTGNSNNAMGYLSLYANTTGNSNSAMGYYSLRYNTTGTNNNAMGYLSLYNNTTGTNNNAMGVNSLRYNTTGSYNNAMGVNSLYDLEDGSSNTGVGYNTGRGITHGSGNTILGASVTGLDADLTNNIILANGTGAIKAQHDGTNWSLTGNVGIGTPTPLDELHILDSSPRVRLEDDGSGTPYSVLEGDSGNLVFSADKGSGVSNTYVSFETDNSEKMRILSSGNVGIGTPTPAYPLVVDSNVSGISIYSDGNISASGYITRTQVYDKSKGKALNKIKDANEYFNIDGSINHGAFGDSMVSYDKRVVDKVIVEQIDVNVCGEITQTCSIIKGNCSKKDVNSVNCSEDYEQCVDDPMICKMEKQDQNVTIYKIIEEEGVSLDKEIALLKQALYEIKVETCEKNKSYSWCS